MEIYAKFFIENLGMLSLQYVLKKIPKKRSNNFCFIKLLDWILNKSHVFSFPFFLAGL